MSLLIRQVFSFCVFAFLFLELFPSVCAFFFFSFPSSSLTRGWPPPRPYARDPAARLRADSRLRLARVLSAAVEFLAFERIFIFFHLSLVLPSSSSPFIFSALPQHFRSLFFYLPSRPSRKKISPLLPLLFLPRNTLYQSEKKSRGHSVRDTQGEIKKG